MNRIIILALMLYGCGSEIAVSLPTAPAATDTGTGTGTATSTATAPGAAAPLWLDQPSDSSAPVTWFAVYYGQEHADRLFGWTTDKDAAEAKVQDFQAQGFKTEIDSQAIGGGFRVQPRGA